MASLRQKESKIPLRVDLKLQNGSKIPLRVNQKTLSKPKIFSSAEPELKKPSAIGRNKKPATEVKRVKNSNLSSQVLKDRNKAATKEVPQKLKSAKGMEKENPLSFEKRISNMNTKAEKKQIKNSNHPSQLLKDRNKTATKEVSQILKPAEGKEIANPLLSFEKRIPEINIQDDDPFKTITEKKQIKNSNHPSQPNIEFVADERMKRLILSNKELTPSVLKSCSSIKISSVMERPSMYSKLHKVPVDPYKQALADIANCDLASEGRRFSEMQRNRLYVSPVSNRNSLYKHLKFVGDPYQEAMKSIAKLRDQKIKSCKKKVTFNLSGDAQSSDSEVKGGNHREKSVSTMQPKLNEISGKGLGSTTLPTSIFKRNILLTPGNNPSVKVTFDSSSKPDEVLGDRLISKKTDSNQLEIKTDSNQLEIKTDSNQLEKQADILNNKTSVSASSLKAAANNEDVQDLSPIFQKTGKYTSIFNHEIKNSMLKNTENPFLNLVRTSEFRQSLFSNQAERFLDKMNPKIKTTENPFLNSVRTSEFRQSLFSNQNERLLDKMDPKLFTPQPVSFYPRTKLSESISPEFLSRRTTDILSCAPINTPLVLKSLSKLELSPVCKKLEFKDSPKESKKEAGDSRENSQTFYLQNIMTQQKILDQLAHQECSIFMHEAEFPCETRENLQNPIARILNNGDEMHFVPLWRLS